MLKVVFSIVYLSLKKSSLYMGHWRMHTAFKFSKPEIVPYTSWLGLLRRIYSGCCFKTARKRAGLTALLHLLCSHSSLALALGSAEKIFSLFWSSEFRVKEKRVIKKSRQDHFPSLNPQFRAWSDRTATAVQADVCFLLTLFLSTLWKSQSFFPIRPGFAQ